MSNHHLDRRALLLAGAGAVATAGLLTFEPAVAGTTTTKRFRGRFSSPDTPDWHYLPFHVPSGVREIEVSYTHDPPQDTGLGYSQNVVDIGIFDSSGRGLGNAAGFRGWSGGARDSFRISKTSATPGYLAGPITAGRWRIVLGPYQIVPPGTPYTVTVRLHHGPAGKAYTPTPAPTSVSGTGPGWYRGDLHVHTVHSDGSQTQAQVLADARAAGLDFIGSSEHNTSSAQLTWGKYVPDDFLVIPGEEVTTRAGHWVAAGLSAGTWIDWRYRPEDQQLERFTDLVRSKGGLAIVAHPYVPVPSIRWDFGEDFAHMDAVEVWNGPWETFDDQAVRRWHRLLLAGTFVPAVGNSDSHNHAQRIGLAQTVVRAESLSVEAILAGYRGGHSWIAGSSDVGLDFSATLDEVSGQCGDTVPSGVGDLVDVRLTVTGVPDAVATLIGPSGVLGTAQAVDGTITLDQAVPGGLAFVRAEVRRATTMLALTNPIFLAVRTPSAG
ncbi:MULTISPECIES: CehA/McbA family metallohydrolase [unclassified Nocardioides]|uniref:CehA/McbA family metallohydrolase n=1 Tax=unclassified Nocardioides TaxID=2615069 RepID=UPI0009F13E72|nr:MULTISPECIES: CehA/McbA family metallohydrolase [unclassified Nocardioides]GAW49029.1 phosphotransferase domain-containing protein [Nocardioides sp. PD653-B2]GAW53185.1 phosphotransferase domain-containing protein [Nocardioides sp. PD653]